MDTRINALFTTGSGIVSNTQIITGTRDTVAEELDTLLNAPGQIRRIVYLSVQPYVFADEAGSTGDNPWICATVVWQSVL